MHVVPRDIDTTPGPRQYRNRPPAPTLGVSLSEPLIATIHLIEGDPIVRSEILASLANLKASVVVFSTANQYLEYRRSDSASCIVLNNQLPDLSGLQLQAVLAASSAVPLIFISDQCDAASAVSAMKAGAMDFFIKPFGLSDLNESVRAAIIQDRKRRQRNAEVAKLQDRFNLLTPREREVLPLVVGGLLNKQAACVLGISEVTLQIHRSQVMRKMCAESLADLVRMAVRLRVPPRRETQLACQKREERVRTVTAVA
jgi:FixJ family two-component response regulator